MRPTLGVLEVRGREESLEGLGRTLTVSSLPRSQKTRGACFGVGGIGALLVSRSSGSIGTVAMTFIHESLGTKGEKRA